MKYFSMFSGIGGFEYGINQSNVEMECVGHAEIDKFASSIYSRHFPEHRNFGDVRKIKTEELPDFEFLVGGFPCQSFSIAGKRKGFEDTRGTLFFEIARILKDKKPRYFLLENVKHFLSHGQGKTIKRVFEVFNELGYDVSWSVHNSCNHGVPQNRERVFLKGYFREKCGQEIFHIRRGKKENPAIVNGYYVLSRSAYYYPNNDTVSGTITGNGQKSGGRNLITDKCTDDLTFHENPDDYLIRKLTPIECERLQGFPDDYTKYGIDDEVISDTQRYKCLGNAVTTNVITDIINEMFFD